MMRLIQKNDALFAVNDAGRFVGKIVNQIDGNCVENPDNDSPGLFAQIFEGHGYIYHQDDALNPFFIQHWDQVFSNPELLPSGTKNVFVDQTQTAKDDFDAILVG